MGNEPTAPADCPFCQRGDLLQATVVADGNAAYLARPVSNPGNYLIIPKAHVESPLELPADWWQAMQEQLRNIPELSGDYNISLNVGPAAGQTVKHLHFWVIPRAADLPSSGKGLARLINDANAE